MLHVKLVKYLYIGITLLALVCPINFSFWSFVPGIILMWLFFILYYAGISNKAINFSQYNEIIEENRSHRIPIIIAIIYLLFYPFYIRYYTGNNIISTFMNFNSGISNYSQYQLHFSGQGLGRFTLEKLPFILGHGFLRFMFIGIVFRNIIYKKNPSHINIISMFIMVLVIICLGIARGTSYEFFELFLIFFFAIVLKRFMSRSKKLISRKVMIRIIVVSTIILIIFVYNIQVRMGDSFSFFKDPRFDHDALIYKIAKPIALVLFPLYDYFLFGIHFTSVIITELWFSKVLGFIAMILPYGMDIIGMKDGYREFVGLYIDLGTRWTPDYIRLISSFGIILSFVLVYLLGRFSRILYSSLSKNLHASILLFYSCYIMFSFPVGNFITTSSANLITIMLSLVFYRFNFISRRLFNM